MITRETAVQHTRDANARHADVSTQHKKHWVVFDPDTNKLIDVAYDHNSAFLRADSVQRTSDVSIAAAEFVNTRWVVTIHNFKKKKPS